MEPSTSDANLRELGKNQANAFNAMIEHHIKERHEIHAVLTAEQTDRLKTIKMHHEEHGDGQDGKHDHH